MKDKLAVPKIIYSVFLLLAGLISGALSYYMIGAVKDLYNDLSVVDLPIFTDILLNSFPLIPVLSFGMFSLIAIYFIVSAFIDFKIKNYIDVLMIIASIFSFILAFVVVILTYIPIYQISDFV